jgi:hypothetical protein
VQRDGLFVGHGGARHDLNADIAESFFVSLYPAWTAFFEQTLPSLIHELQTELVACTERALHDLGATSAAVIAVHSKFFEREATTLISRERVEVIGAVIEALREELRETYRELAQVVEPMTKQQIVRAVIEAVVEKQELLRDAVTDELDTWLSAIAENLDELVHDEIASRRDRLRHVALPD